MKMTRAAGAFGLAVVFGFSVFVLFSGPGCGFARRGEVFRSATMPPLIEEGLNRADSQREDVPTLGSPLFEIVPAGFEQ